MMAHSAVSTPFEDDWVLTAIAYSTFCIFITMGLFSSFEFRGSGKV